MLNIVLPIAGRGSRFAVAGYQQPKPLIPVHGVPMIALVADNVRPNRAHRFIFVAQQEHLKHTDLGSVLESAAPGCQIISIDGVTEGAACTVLAARHLIDSDDALMLANSDQYVDTDIDAYLAIGDTPGVDGHLMTFPANDPKWSFVRRNEAGDVVEIVEKVVVSDEATVGIYNFRRGADFVRAADRMIAADLRVNGEFYVAPVYNQLIGHGARITTYDIGQTMYGLGVPEDLRAFCEVPWSRDRAAMSRGIA